MIDWRAFFSLLMAAGILALALPAPAHAGMATASITGFVKNPTKIGGNYIRQSNVLMTLEDAVIRAETTYVSTALGKSVLGPVVLEVLPVVAGPAIARACFNPIGAALCAGGAMAAYYELSRLYLEDDEWLKEQDEFGPCYQTRHFQTSDPWFGCTSSISSAVSTWVNTANASGYMDDGTGNSGYRDDYSFETVTVPTSIALNSTANASVKRTLERTSITTGIVTVSSNTIQVLVFHAPDNITITRVPATESDMLTHANNYPITPEVLNEYEGSIPVSNVKPGKGAATLGDPYSPDDTPNEGEWVQDRVVTQPDPATPDDTDLIPTTETVPVDNPNTPEVEGPVDGSDPDAGSPDGPAPPDEGLCEEYPEISACQVLGTAPGDEVPREDVELEYAAEGFGLPSGCPPDVPLYKGSVFSFGPLCEKAPVIRPVVVALAGFVALGICVAALRGAA